jgi:GNAT superfamily N-acetyltransferase
VSEPTIVVVEQPDEGDRKAVLDALLAFNEKAGGPSRLQPLAVLIRDPANGKTLGGLWGRTSYDWLFVEFLVVPEQFRGQDIGSELLSRAEDIARQRGCVGVWLDTYAFQAPGFYKKRGYEIFGTIEDHPRGARRFFLKKTFAPH